MKIKRILSGVLAAVVAISSVALASLSAFAVDGAAKDTYVINDTISATLYTDNTLIFSGEGEIPGAAINGILEVPFATKQAAEALVVEEGITIIGGNVFARMTNVKTVTLASSVVKLEDKAFYSLDKATIYIKGSNVEFGGSLEKLSGKVYIYDKATYDNFIAAGGSADIVVLEVPEPPVEEPTVKDTYVINDTISATLYTDNTLIFSGEGEIPGAAINGILEVPFATKQAAEALVVEEGITTIGGNVFARMTNVKTVTLASSVVKLEDKAFYSLDKATIYIKGSNVEFGGSLEKLSGKVYIYDKATYDNFIAAGGSADIVVLEVPEPKVGNVSGKIVVSDENAETEMTVTATAVDGTETSVTATSMGTYTIENLIVGDYTLTISGGKYVERAYEITVTEEGISQEVNLNPLGDINGDGDITTADVGMANSHAKGVKTLEGYEFDCANVKVDGEVSTADVGMINSHAKGVKAL